MIVRLSNGDFIEGVDKIEQKWGKFVISLALKGHHIQVPLDAILLVEEEEE